MAIGVLGVGFASRPVTPEGGLFYQPPLVAAPAMPSTPPIVTGIEPAAYEAILYGKQKPVFVGGKALLGGRPCEGVFWGGTQANPLVSFIAYHAEAANPLGTRTVTEARLRGKVVTYDGGGNLTDATLAGGRVEFRVGAKYQLPFQQSIDRYGDGAIAYRDGILSCWYNIPVKPFGGIVPMPSIEVADSSFGDPADGITRKDAIEVLLRRSRLQDSEFEVSVPGSDSAWIVATESSLLEFLQRLRALFVHWNITYTDKLRIIDPTDFTITCDITRRNHVRDSLRFNKLDPLTIPRKKNYTYIDEERDFEPNTVVAQEDIYPTPNTASVDESSVELPIVTTAAQATADIHVSLYEELAARSQMDAALMPSLFDTEPGDTCRFADHDHIAYVGRVMETQHNFENYQCEIRSVEILNCGALVAEQSAEHVICYNRSFTSATVHTEPSVILGAATGNRHSIVAFALYMDAIGGDVTSVTINGVTATRAVLKSHSVQGFITAIYHAPTPTDATGEVVITTSQEFHQMSAMMYRAVSSSFAVHDTDTNEGTFEGTFTVNVDIPAGGIAIAMAGTRNGVPFTWNAEVTEDCTFVNDNPAQGQQVTAQRSSASHQPVEAEPNFAFSVEPASPDRVTICAASFAL